MAKAPTAKRPRTATDSCEYEQLSTGWVHTPLQRGRSSDGRRRDFYICADGDFEDAIFNLHDILRPEFWLELAQGTSVTCCASSTWERRSRPCSPSDWEGLGEQRARLREEGYSRLANATEPLEANALARAVATLVRYGWHPLWCVVFDEAWLWLARIAPILSSLVHPEATPNYDFMSWYIDAAKCKKGWTPHRDRCTMDFQPDGAPQYATVWLSLTEATLLNGCIHILPANFDRVYLSNDLDKTQSHDEKQTNEWLQDIRALPCEQAEALVWTGRALHFGGRSCRRAPVPRIALACAVSVPAFEDPDMRCPNLWQQQPSHTEKQEPSRSRSGEDISAPVQRMRMPSLAERLNVIATQLFHYDAPLGESSIQICAQERRLLQALDEFFSTGGDTAR